MCVCTAVEDKSEGIVNNVVNIVIAFFLDTFYCGINVMACRVEHYPERIYPCRVIILGIIYRKRVCLRLFVAPFGEGFLLIKLKLAPIEDVFFDKCHIIFLRI